MSLLNFQIVQAQSEEDLASIFELEKAAFGPYGTDNSPEIIRLQYETFPDGFIVAKNGDEVIGYSSSEIWAELRSPKMGEDPRKTHSPNGAVFCITTMVVREDKQGAGIGSAMLDYLVSVASSHGCDTLIVETPRTRTFYEKHGFSLLRMEKDRGLDVAVLTRSLGAT